MTPSAIRRLDVLRIRAQHSGATVAHDDTTTQMTFADWNREADEIGGGLAAAGIVPGDRVLMPITNQHATQMAACFIGAQRAGAIAVPVNTRLALAELEAFRALVGARVAITGIPGITAQLGVSRSYTTNEVPRHASALPDQSSPPVDGDSDIIGTSGTTGRRRASSSRTLNWSTDSTE